MKVSFVNHNGESLDLTTWPIMLQDPEKLLKVTRSNNSTDRTTEGIIVSRWYKRSQEYTLTVSIFADSEAEFYETVDLFERIAAPDIIDATPGRIHLGGSYMPAYLSELEASDWDPDSFSADISITLLSPYPYWSTETTVNFLAANAAEANACKTYPYRYPHQYGNSLISSSLTNEAFAPCKFQMILYGPCSDPSVYIAGHEYNVNVTLLAGQRLTIDSREKTILMTDVDGTKINCFHLRKRDSYIFEPIPVGTSPLIRSDNFGVELTLIEERSTPAWT